MAASRPSPRRLIPAIVLRTDEQRCTVALTGSTQVVRYAAPFPRPRTQRVAPGHLVAVAALPGGAQAVVWRWFDAVVLSSSAGEVTLWEPGHGVVTAQPRDPSRHYPPGSRAYLSAGLPGADWWVCGPAVAEPGDADVDLPEVEAFLTGLGLFVARA